MTTQQSSSEQKIGEAIQAEIGEVRQQLLAVLADLASPLGELVRSQLEHSISEFRIGLLLVAARRPEAIEQARQQRILLSTALEMLCLALRIHKLLLNHTPTNGVQFGERSWIGSIILAGDYCFSRAALLAAQTNLPRVVEIFAQALKTVNEELLRRLFSSVDGMQTEAFDESGELVDAGLRAAIVIADMDEQSASETIKFGQKLFKQVNTSLLPQVRLLEIPVTLTTFQRPYWQALVSLQPSKGTM